MVVRILMLIALLAVSQTAVAQLPDPMAGWNILQECYDQDHLLDVISYEWEYFTITDEKADFRAVISYLVSNPRDRLSNFVQLLPDGGNMAIIGCHGDQRPHAEYVNFGPDNYEASLNERFFEGFDPQTGFWGSLTPMPGSGPGGVDAKRLQGVSEYYEWDLVVYQDWTDRAITEDRLLMIDDIGVLPGELWNIDIDWPRTRVEGTVTIRETGEVRTIKGHGYHDNVWGRYNTVLDGWDTLFFTESPAQLSEKGLEADKGIYLTTHIYHKSRQADFTEISFYDEENLKVLRFFADDGEMTWYHPHWEWDDLSWQCVPVDGYYRLENDEYLIEINTEVPRNKMGTLLSDETFFVDLYSINEYFPYFEGEIIHKPTGRLVRQFSGPGGGEFAFHKSARIWPASQLSCNLWGWSLFSKR